METIEDIVREMRKNGVVHDPRHFNELCDRIESALKRERAQHAEVLRAQIDEVQRAAVYKEALKPVLECDSTVGESMHAVVEARRIWREWMGGVQ